MSWSYPTLKRVRAVGALRLIHRSASEFLYILRLACEFLILSVIPIVKPVAQILREIYRRLNLPFTQPGGMLKKAGAYMSTMKNRILASLLVAIAFSPLAAMAETASHYDTCGDGDANIDDRINTCSRIIAESPQIPNQAEAYRNRGEAYLDRGQYDLAIADETKAISLNAQDAIAYNLRAWALLKTGDARKALSDADKSLSINPEYAYALDTRAQTYEALGMKKEAILDYKRALTVDPELDESKSGLTRLGGH